MEPLINALVLEYPHISFVPGDTFYWSPRKREVHYKKTGAKPESAYTLLHETGHALLGHTAYRTDFELLSMEVAAWQEAKRIAPLFTVTIDDGHIQDCLDSYRDWLYRRSVCPACSNRALQQDNKPIYHCHNCHAIWHVTRSRFCRPYRQARAPEASAVIAP